MKIINFFFTNNIIEEHFSRKRSEVLLYFIFLIYLLLIGRIIYVSKYREISQEEKIYINSNIPQRVNIIDRTGVLIATDIELYDFYLNRDLVANVKEVADKVAKIFPDIDKKSLLGKLQSMSRNREIFIKKQITKYQREEIVKSGILGFVFKDNMGRVYPHKNLFSHLVGYVNSDKKGMMGIELEYDTYLNNIGNHPLQLTADARVQAILKQELAKAMKKYNAKSVLGIVSEVKTGNIIALVNLPDFDPNIYYKQVNSPAFYNRSTFGIYEMGSIFKIFTIAMALDKKIVAPNDKFDVSQIINYGKFQIKQDFFSKRYLTPIEVLEKSSNVGAALIGQKIGIDAMKDFYKKLGFFDKLPTHYPSLGYPQTRKKWKEGDILTISYGYGFAVTPLHVVTGVNGIVNNGIMKFPRFTTRDDTMEKQIISPETSSIMRQYLRSVVSNGTGFRGNVLGFSVGGKTGSARRLNKKGEYEEDKIFANFIGIITMNNPSYSIYVMVEEPKLNDKNLEVAASTIAAPIVGRIIENITPILKILPYMQIQ